MMLDGEWRVSFIKNEHPDLQYGTAPMPVDDTKPSLYGSGLHQRDDHRHPEERQEPRRGLGARQVPDDERPCAGKFSNGIRNVPSTRSSSVSPELTPDKNFSTFLKIFTNPNSTTSPITPIGADHLQTFTNFFVKCYAGKVKDLEAGLRDVDKTIDAKIEQAGKGGGGVP